MNVGRRMAPLLLLLAASVSIKSFSPQQVRDVRREASGTGSITGRVVDDGPDSRPLRRATLTLSSTALMTNRLALTSEEGTFVFDGLPAGTYGLSVFRPGYMRTEYGARRPGGSGSTIALAEGQRVADVELRLSRYSAITGAIYDHEGEPAVGVSVEALRYTMRTGRRTLSNVYGQPAFTDDRGVYRLDGLTPGEYYVVAGPSPSRGPNDVVQLTTTVVDRMLQVLRSPAAPAAAIPADTPRRTFAPVFHPGTPDLAAATVFKLGLGEERGGADIRLQLVPAGRLTGTVTREDGTPASTGTVAVTPLIEANTMDLFSATFLGNARVDEQGNFVLFSAVPPGRYLLTATLPDGKGGATWGLQEATLDGSDRHIALTLGPGGTIAGRINLSGSGLKPPASLTAIRLTATSVTAHLGAAFSTATAIAQPDGTFILSPLAPGLYRLTANSPVQPGWSVRSLVADGSDLLDGPVLIRPGTTIADTVLMYTDRPTEIAGTLHTPAGDPTADYFIIAFASDRKHWTPMNRRQMMARPASNGRYAISNLPPGEYLVAAVTDVEPGSWWDPAWLEQLQTGAVRVTLAEGERRVLDLKIGRAPSN